MTPNNDNPNLFSAIISEYTVSPTNRNEIIFGAHDGKIFKTGRSDGEENPEKVKAIKNIIVNNLENIKTQNDKHASNIKGGRQATLSIKLDGEKYHIIGNTPDPEVSELYQQLREQISQIIF